MFNLFVFSYLLFRRYCLDIFTACFSVICIFLFLLKFTNSFSSNFQYTLWTVINWCALIKYETSLETALITKNMIHVEVLEAVKYARIYYMSWPLGAFISFQIVALIVILDFNNMNRIVNCKFDEESLVEIKYSDR